VNDVVDLVPAVLPPLRGLGPRVFVSYSFRDADLARQIGAHLEQAGMQVRMEDETSLLAAPLSISLQTRIRDAEVFLQVLTETSARSPWVAREFGWAAAANEDGTGPAVMLPVVIGEIGVPEPVADWCFLKCPPVLDERSLDAVRRAAMGAVALLPIDPCQPYQLAERELEAYCSGPEKLHDRRLIVDPDGILPALVHATVSYGAGLAVEHQKKITEQQRRDFDRFLRRLAVLDAYVPEFVRHVRPMATVHWGPSEWPRQLADVVQRFVRLSVGGKVLSLTRSWLTVILSAMPASAVTHCESALARSEELQAAERGGDLGAGVGFWALGGSVGQNWLDLAFQGRDGIASVPIRLPEDHFDDVGVLSLTSGFASPAAEVTVTDWLTLGLPQAAAALLPADVAKVADLVRHTGWSIKDYRRSGRR
jgi:hypothetical protein